LKHSHGTLNVNCWGTVQEVLGMDFHVTQPGSSVATSLVAGEAKPKHVLLLEIKVDRSFVLLLNVPVTTLCGCLSFC
jgi:hypothetical protein